MIVECPKCKKKYKIDETKVPVGGAPVKCPNCLNIFTVYREPLDITLTPIETEKTAVPQEPFAEHIKETETPVTSEPLEENLEKPAEATTNIPPTEERTKLWEQLQERYTQSKKAETAPSATIEETAVPTVEEPIEEPTIPQQEEKFVEEPSTTITPETEEPSKTEKPPVSAPEITEEVLETEEDKTAKEAKRLARSLVKDILLYHGDKVEIGLRQGNLAQLIGDEIRKSWKFYKDNFPLEKTGGVNYFKDALNEIIGKGKPIFK